MKPVARQSARVARPVVRPVAHKENLYFFAAMFAILLAGDLMWWETKQISDDFEHSTASLYSATRNQGRELEIMAEDINSLESGAGTELTDLEKIDAEE